jgi:acyl-CoA synthetase (NDP forming)
VSAAIERLLRPRSVAIIGASASPGALGASVLANLERSGYRGDVHLINPNRTEIGARPCLQTIDELPLGIDAAVLAIPRAGVLEAIASLARREVGAAVIFSAGFAEGGEAGRAEQQEIARLAAQHGMLVEGPNCLGMINHVDGIPLTFVETAIAPLRGRPGIAIVSQSGAMACVLSTVLTSRDVAVSYSISTGNEAASGVEDFIEHLTADPHTAVVGLIVEQFRQPRRLLELARRAIRIGKRLVLLHPRRSSAARASAATHTGALAGDYALMRAKVAAEGIITVDTLEELGDVLEIALRTAALLPRGAAVITESGAFKALTLDLCEQVGLPLPVLDDTNAPALRAAIPTFVPVSNPLDLTAQGLVDPQIFARTLSALAADERIGAIIFDVIQTDPATCARKFPTIIAALRELTSSTPIVLAGLDEGAPVPNQYIRALRDLGIPYFASPERAVRAIARLHAAAARDPLEPIDPIMTGDSPLPSGIIPEYDAKDFLGPLGIAFPAGELVGTLAEAIRAADRVGYPVALKAQSAALSHKSDAGGVVLGLSDREALTSGWKKLAADLARNAPGLALDGVRVEAMARPGVELIIGGRNDPQWGAVVLAGFGGVQAELRNDVQLILPGQSLQSVIAALDRLKCGPLLRGYRGCAPLDIPAVAALIQRIGRILSGEPSIREIDLNPVIAYPAGQGVLALDALMMVQRCDP